MFNLSTRNILGQLKKKKTCLFLRHTQAPKPTLEFGGGTPCQQTAMKFYKYEVLVKFLIY